MHNILSVGKRVRDLNWLLLQQIRKPIMHAYREIHFCSNDNSSFSTLFQAYCKEVQGQNTQLESDSLESSFDIDVWPAYWL